jgi:hypothetical protein
MPVSYRLQDWEGNGYCDYQGYGNNNYYGGKSAGAKPNYFTWAKELLTSSGSKQTFGCFISQAKVKNLYKKTFGGPAKKTTKAPAKKATKATKATKAEMLEDVEYNIPAGFKFPTNFLMRKAPAKKAPAKKAPAKKKKLD